MNNKLSFFTKFGYGLGMIGECLAMNTFYIYFLFFLTDGVGMAAGIAGTVAMIGTFWGAFTDLFAGTKTDRSKNPKGRRRPFIFKAAILLCIFTALMYTDWSVIPMSIKPVYFIVMSAAFWLVLSFTDLPYQSLASEITDDYQEKNSIRSIGNILNYAGMILASSGTLTIVYALGGDTHAWSMVGIIFGIITVVCYWISVLVTKGKEPNNPNLTAKDVAAPTQKISIIGMIKDSISIKPMRQILLYTIFAYGGMILITSIYIYYLSCNVGMTEAQSATVMLLYCLMVMVLSALFGVIKIEKKIIVIVSTLAGGIILATAHFVGSSIIIVYVMFFALACVIAAFFVQIYSMVYDVCDIDTYKSGGSRAASIIAVFTFTGKIIGGVAMAAVGWILQASGYDAMAMVQSSTCLNGISIGTLLLPAILLIVGMLFMIKYPINAKNNAALKEAIAAKAEGKEYSEEGFKELL